MQIDKRQIERRNRIYKKKMKSFVLFFANLVQSMITDHRSFLLDFRRNLNISKKKKTNEIQFKHSILG